MTLADRVKLVDEMIRENPDVTIRDYISVARELELVKSAKGSLGRLMFMRKLDEEAKDIIRTMKPIQLNKNIGERYKDLRR